MFKTQKGRKKLRKYMLLTKKKCKKKNDDLQQFFFITLATRYLAPSAHTTIIKGFAIYSLSFIKVPNPYTEVLVPDMSLRLLLTQWRLCNSQELGGVYYFGTRSYSHFFYSEMMVSITSLIFSNPKHKQQRFLVSNLTFQ